MISRRKTNRLLAAGGRRLAAGGLSNGFAGAAGRWLKAAGRQQAVLLLLSSASLGAQAKLTAADY